MNERINEIHRQVMSWSDTPDCPSGMEWGHIPEEYTQKFAELIVKECIHRCEEIALKHQFVETTYVAGKKAGAFECAEDLKEHFGVIDAKIL